MCGRQLERWLYFAVHGKPAPRASRRRPRRGPSRDWKYRAWVRSLPCAACGATVDVQAAHTGDRGLGQKASDYSCVPLCRSCHAEYDNGLESSALFEAASGIEMRRIVERLNHDWFAYSGAVK